MIKELHIFIEVTFQELLSQLTEINTFPDFGIIHLVYIKFHDIINSKHFAKSFHTSRFTTDWKLISRYPT